MRIPANLMLIAAVLQVAAIALWSFDGAGPLLFGAIVAGLIGLWLRRGGRLASWVSFFVACGGMIAAAAYAGGSTGLAAGVFWAIFAATGLTAILLFTRLWKSAAATAAV